MRLDIIVVKMMKAEPILLRDHGLLLLIVINDVVPYVISCYDTVPVPVPCKLQCMLAIDSRY